MLCITGITGISQTKDCGGAMKSFRSSSKKKARVTAPATGQEDACVVNIESKVANLESTLLATDSSTSYGISQFKGGPQKKFRVNRNAAGLKLDIKDSNYNIPNLEAASLDARRRTSSMSEDIFKQKTGTRSRQSLNANASSPRKSPRGRSGSYTPTYANHLPHNAGSMFSQWKGFATESEGDNDSSTENEDHDKNGVPSESTSLLPRTPRSFKKRCADFATSLPFFDYLPDAGMGAAIPIAVTINILDSVTFGMIVFPPCLNEFSSIGVSSFLLSTAIVQIVFSGFSQFKCALGTSMAENIPFLHTIANGIYDTLKDTHTKPQILANVLVAFSMSTILNGLCFYLVGKYEMGRIMHHFPRHVIVGVIGGFGVFLLGTSLEIATALTFSWENTEVIIDVLMTEQVRWLWLSVVIMQVCLRFMAYTTESQIVVPAFMLMVPLFFYGGMFTFGHTVDDLRQHGWLFPESGQTSFTELWTAIDFEAIDMSVILQQSQTMASLAAFTVLMVPIRIPTLALTVGETVDFNHEIRMHGIANIIAGMFGSLHNYLSYANAVFVYKCGQKSWEKCPDIVMRLCGFVIAGITLIFFFIGPTFTAYVPRFLAGLILMHLAVDLIMEALIQPRQDLDPFEYFTVVAITMAVAVFGFMWAVALGVVLAMMSFVLQSGRNSCVRGTFSGGVARSNTFRSAIQRLALHKHHASSRLFIMQLQGYIFFGNYQSMADRIETISSNNMVTTNKLRAMNSRRWSKSNGRSKAGSSQNVFFAKNSGASIKHMNERQQGQQLSESDWEDVASQTDHLTNLRKFMVVDMSFVSGLDSTSSHAMLNLQAKMIDKYQVELMFAGCVKDTVREQLLASGVEDENIFRDVNRALFIAEEIILHETNSLMSSAQLDGSSDDGEEGIEYPYPYSLFLSLTHHDWPSLSIG
jgi:MFS superfamily sulfate permease-like transporter